MRTPSNNVIRAMFDVKPLDENGQIPFARLDAITETISLRGGYFKPKVVKAILASTPDAKPLPTVPEPETVLDSELNPEPYEDPDTLDHIEEANKNEEKDSDRDDKTVAEIADNVDTITPVFVPPIDKHALMDELREALLASSDIESELSRAGVQFYSPVVQKARPKAVAVSKILPPKIYEAPENLPIVMIPGTAAVEESVQQLDLRNFEIPKEQAFDSFMAKKAAAASPAAREVEHFLEELRKTAKPSITATVAVKARKIRIKIPAWLKKKPILILIGIALSASLVRGGFIIKNDILMDGNRALLNLQNAQANLEDFDFLSAANHFALASKNFSEASDKLNLLGTSVISLFSDVPGLNKIKAANNMVKAGENISKAGEELSDAFDELSRTNFVAYFGSNSQSRRPLSDFIGKFRDSLVFAKEKIENSRKLLSGLDPLTIPEEKRQIFIDFREKIPDIQKFVAGAVNYSDFLLEFVGAHGPKRYLVLFQNNSELRPTGGFPGTYGVLEFDDGYMKNIFVDDIYKVDGQMRENIIPPKEMQHITPTWGMRDANWWADFPTSARKVMEMYEKNGEPAVDGVLTLTPAIITRILEVTGSVDVPEYGMKLGADNFLSLVQAEVEYGDHKEDNQPKKIIKDFTPKFLELLGEQDKEHWVRIFQILVDGAAEKQILAYFSAPDLQKVVLENNFAGEVKKTADDFLMVTYTNVKGSKGDAVTKNAMNVQARVTKDGFIEHTVTLSRTHNGGKTPYGFYNRQNPSYVRIMVPAGSELLDINGNTSYNPAPLIAYAGGRFSTDSDLNEYETQVRRERGIKIFSESGKTVFGFWMVVDPGAAKKTVIKYLTPIKVRDNTYSLLVQKQPGTVQDKLNISFAMPDSAQPVFKYPEELQVINNSVIFDSDLKTDKNIAVQWSN